jgi:hypothetical protein
MCTLFSGGQSPKMKPPQINGPRNSRSDGPEFPLVSCIGDLKVKVRPCPQTSRTPISRYSTYDPDPTGSMALIPFSLSMPDEPPTILFVTQCDRTIFMVSTLLSGSTLSFIRDSMNLQRIILRQPLLWI